MGIYSQHMVLNVEVVHINNKVLRDLYLILKEDNIFSSPGRSPGRAIVLPPASASALAAASAKC